MIATEEKRASHRAYWDKNKEQLNARRRKRYADDPGIRERALSRAKAYIERPGVRDKRIRHMAKKHVERQLILWGIKKESGCVHCGESDPLVLDFHHRDPKDKVSKLPTMSSRSWESVDAELQKCDVVCANCHARQHRVDWGALLESEQL